MDRKHFFKFFWKKYIRLVFLILIFVLLILNISKLFELITGFGLIILISTIFFLILAFFQLILSSIKNKIPHMINKRIIVVNQYIEKWSFLFPIVLIVFLCYFWDSLGISEVAVYFGGITYLIFDILKNINIKERFLN